ncbi:MAG TPA: NERD domain-containing protein [Rhodanobacteraceae bacterium]
MGHLPHSIWIVFGLFAGAVWLLQLSSVKGALGELWVRLAIWRHLAKDEYVPLHDVTLRTPDGTTQIDHIIVSRFGVFVLETKNMRGWIFGAERDARWTQTFGRRHFRFQNPLRQNYKHTIAVAHALDIDADCVRPVVVFVGSATFKNPMPANVTVGRGFVSYISTFRDPVFDALRVGQMVATLQQRNVGNADALRASHVQRLRSRGDPEALRHCPKCGNRLVIKTVRHGARSGQRFWACSAYPSCHFTQSVD